MARPLLVEQTLSCSALLLQCKQTLSCSAVHFTRPKSLKSHHPRLPKHNTSSQHLQTFLHFLQTSLSHFPAQRYITYPLSPFQSAPAANIHLINLSSLHTHTMAPNRKRPHKEGMSTSLELLTFRMPLTHTKTPQNPRRQFLLVAGFSTPKKPSATFTTA